MKINLSNLLAPLPVDEFFQTFWEKKLLHLKRNRPNFYDQILNIKIIDDYLQRQDLSPHGFRLVIKGEEVKSQKWIKEEKQIDGTIKNVICPEKTLDYFHKGATIIINSAQTGIHTLATACRILEQELKISLQSNIYITPPRSQGFVMHYDPHDIISLQIKGSKSWRILDSGENLPTKLKAFQKEPELIDEFQMQAGDLLYIPRGTVHEAFASENSTIHVNFSLKPRYGFHLLEDLAALAEREDVFFRKTIPHGFTNQKERQKYSVEFARKLVELIEKHTSEELLERQFERFVENQQFDFQDRFTDLLELEELSLDSVVSRRAEMTLLVKNKAGEIRIKFGKNQITIPKFVQPKIFLQNKPFTASDIEGLITNQGKIELIKNFIKEGFLKIEKV